MNRIKLFLTILALVFNFYAFPSNVFADPAIIPISPSDLFPLSIPSGPISTADYYVSPTGSDAASNPCTMSASPCQSINIALSKIPTTVTDSVIIRLAAGNYASATINKNVILRGHSALDTRIDGQHTARALQVSASFNVQLEDLAIVGGNAADQDGGGILNSGSLALERVAVMNNSAAQGGGIKNNAGATLMVEDSSVTGNIATGNGGGIYNQGTLSVLNTTISANWVNGAGGGVYIVRNTPDTPVKFAFTTLSFNVANADRTGPDSDTGAGIYLQNYSTIEIKNTMLAGNIVGTGSAGGNESAPSDCGKDGDEYVISQFGLNLFSFLGGCFSPGPLQDYRLGSLFYNGGSTLSQAILEGSPAIDAVTTTDCTDLDGSLVNHDQRGVLRGTTAYGACDVGAFEASPILVPVYVSADTEYFLSSMNLGSTPVGTPSTSIIRLKNIGQKPLTTVSGAFSPVAGFTIIPVTDTYGTAGGVPTLPDGVVRNCENVLPGQTCLLGLQFAPTEVRAYSSSLSFTGNNPAIFSSLTRVAVSGTGTAAVAHSASFSLSSTPGPDVSINLGGNLSIQVTVNPSTFAGNPNFTLQGTLPHGLMGSFVYSAMTHQAILRLSIGSDGTVTTTPAALQIQAVVSSVAGTETVQIPLNLTVNPAGGPVGATAPITLALSSTSTSLLQGQTTPAINVTLTRASFPGVVILSMDGDNVDGVTANFTPNNLTGNASTLTFTASPSAAAGVRNLRVVATSGTTVQRTNFTLTVVSSSGAAPGGGATPPGDGIEVPLGSGSSGGGCSLDASAGPASFAWMLSLLTLVAMRFRKRD